MHDSPNLIPSDLTYRVSLPDFEGPLDLLLHLIQKHELSIADLPVSFITEKYLEYLSLMQVLQIDIASEYLVMAATLVHLKSKTLLPPDPKASKDPELNENELLDPREELIRRLLEYQKYKDAAEQLNSRAVVGRDTFVRSVYVEASKELAPLAEVGLFRLLEAFQSVLSNAKVELKHEVTTDRISITEKIHELCDVLRIRGRAEFTDLFSEFVTRFDFVITFLAILEMTRLRMTRVVQTEPFAPLFIELTVLDDEAFNEAKKRLPHI